MIGDWSQSHAHASGHRQTTSSTLLRTTVVQHNHAQVSLPRQQVSLGGPSLDLTISFSTALSHGSASSFDRAAVKTASRRIRVTILPRSTWHALALHDERRTCGSVLTAPATSQRLRSLRAGASAIACHLRRPRDWPGGSSLPRHPLRSCPALCRPRRHASAPLAAGESPIPA